VAIFDKSKYVLEESELVELKAYLEASLNKIEEDLKNRHETAETGPLSS